MEASKLPAMGAAAMAQAVRDGQVSAEALVQAHLQRIAERDEQLGAFAHIDPHFALTQARETDARRRAGRPIGPLGGVPVAVKDIFDTEALPTENGSRLHSGRRPTRNAAVVDALRRAGAVILGKTVTAEMATYTPGRTANPHDPARTPGGSSSGSAAAVAAQMAPLALGSQTNGSVVRPASYCGICGFKPSRGLISRRGMLQLSPTLDHVGVFARSVMDLALLADALTGFDDRDEAMQPLPPPPLYAVAGEAPPVTPNLAFVKTAAWDAAEPSTRAAFAELVEHLGATIHEVPLPSVFAHAVEAHGTIMQAEMAVALGADYARGREKMSRHLCELIEAGKAITAEQYQKALAIRHAIQGELDELFTAYDAVVTPAATGEAPLGLDSTGNPVFCSLWTLAGVPALSLPLMGGPAGLPLGVQLVGGMNDDARLLRTARWLAASLLAPEAAAPRRATRSAQRKKR